MILTFREPILFPAISKNKADIVQEKATDIEIISPKKFIYIFYKATNLNKYFFNFGFIITPAMEQSGSQVQNNSEKLQKQQSKNASAHFHRLSTQSSPSHKCSFCDNYIDPEDKFCCECGNPIGGIVCPNCSTLNHGSFCLRCNSPLDDIAKEELKKAQKDPQFIKIQAIAAEIEELQSNFEETITQKETTGRESGNSEKITLKIKTVSEKETEKAYREKVEELNELMRQLIPERGSTPQMQRNYYSARRLPVVTKTQKKVPVCWVCNLCGYRHSHPQECAQPDLGGTWYYDIIETEHVSFEYE